MTNQDLSHLNPERVRGRRAAAGAACAAAVLLLLPGYAAGQAVCSAPHSSPTIPSTGYSITEPPGSGWVQFTFYRHDTREQFGTTGRIEPFFAQGHATTTSLFVTAALGLVRGVDAWMQLPVHNLRFDGGAGRRERTGFGDSRLQLRVSPELFGSRIPVALRAGVKFPGGDFPVDPDLIPLTEGQRDWDLSLQLGRSLQSLPVYVMGSVGYRWREEDIDRARKPGDERFAYLAVGGQWQRLGWELGLEGLSGLPPRSQGLELETARRTMLQVFPNLGMNVGPGQVEVGGRIPLYGRNLPAGSALTLGYVVDWGRR